MPKTGLGALYEHVLQTRMVLQLFIRTTWSKLLEIELNWIEFIDKQPMKAGQGLKKSLAMRRLKQKKNDAHTQK